MFFRKFLRFYGRLMVFQQICSINRLCVSFQIIISGIISEYIFRVYRQENSGLIPPGVIQLSIFPSNSFLTSTDTRFMGHSKLMQRMHSYRLAVKKNNAQETTYPPINRGSLTSQ